MEQFKWRETKSTEERVSGYHKTTPIRYFGEIEYTDYSTHSNTKRVGLSYLSDIRDAYEEYRKNDIDFAY